MDSDFAARIAAPPYYRLIPHVGAESAQFIIDNLLRFSFKRLKLTPMRSTTCASASR
jgi:hypothetical protein